MVGLTATRTAIPASWIFYWLVLPNLLIFAMWPIGGPPMQPVLLISGLLALVISAFCSGIWQRLLLAVMIAVTTLWYVCMMFNISPLNMSVMPAFLREVRPWKSPGYLLGGAIVLAAAILVLIKAPLAPKPRSLRSLVVVLVVIIGIAQLDQAIANSTSSSYNARPESGDPFSSATQRAGLMAPPQSARHVIIVLVEGLGMPVGSEEKAIFDADWDRPNWRERYDVSHGHVPYYGSTTNGELRELCGVWGEYFRFDFDKADCLPKAYRAAGYETSAIHAFDSSFFDRTAWYPLLGFQRMEFKHDLVSEGVPLCGGLFPGACDRDIPALLASRLKQASKPQFVYWLTLNTHLPVIADPQLGTERCELGDQKWRQDMPQLCRMFLLHHQLANAIDAMMMDPDLPAVDMLIVGDHIPPFSDRDYRSRFSPTDVPWIFLRARNDTGRTVGNGPARPHRDVNSARIGPSPRRVPPKP